MEPCGHNFVIDWVEQVFQVNFYVDLLPHFYSQLSYSPSDLIVFIFL